MTTQTNGTDSDTPPSRESFFEQYKRINAASIWLSLLLAVVLVLMGVFTPDTEYLGWGALLGVIGIAGLLVSNFVYGAVPKK
jgi:hypothetical protein